MNEELNIYFIGNIPLIEYSNINTSTIQECYNYLKDKKLISLDIETTCKFKGIYKGEGLNPYLSKIVMLQIGDLERQFVIDYRTTNINLLLSLLIDPEITIVGQNIKFEYLHLFHNEGIRINNMYDTMVVEQILFNGLNPDTSLKGLNRKYLNIEVDKDTRLEFLTIEDTPFTEKQIIYGAEDILYPLKIRDFQLIDANKKDVLNCISLEMLFIEVLGDIEYKGMYFDKEIWKNTYDKNLIELNILHKELDDYVISTYPDSKFIEPQYDLFDSTVKTNIKWSSSKQVIALFKYLNICPEEVSKTTNKLSYTVNGKVLQASLNTINLYANEEKKNLIKKYLEYKKKEQACTTFGIPFFKYVNPITNRLHSSYKQILNTGRISSSNPNLQNIPAEKGFRSAFSCAKGWKIVNADYSGQEQIILANKSMDRDLLHFYEQNLGDMHSYIASKIFPELSELSLDDIKTYHKDKRQIAKAAGFAINYGGNGFTISNNLGISTEQGEEVYNAYFKAFPGLKNYFTSVQKQSHKQGYILIDPLTGRKNWFTPPKTNKDRGKIDRAALNFPIQGEAGGVTKLAPILYRKWIIDNQLENEIFITNIVHDEINVEVKEEYAELAATHLERCMQEAGKRWCTTVLLGADAVITDYWNH